MRAVVRKLQMESWLDPTSGAVTFSTLAIVSNPPRCASFGSGTFLKAYPSTPGMP